MPRRIDFNCDLGEGCDDAAVMPYISSASIACGLHAGDAETMRRTVELCQRHGVAIGAHPSFDDRESFGRREMAWTPGEVYTLVLDQILVLTDVAAAHGARLAHVKPHGALYNMAARNGVLADAIARAVRDADPMLRLVGLSGSALPAAGAAIGLRVLHEVFAERRYEADGTLTPRGQPDAVIENLDASLAQVRMLVRDDRVIARTGESIPLRVDTLCLHGDRSDAAQFARAVRDALEADGVFVEAS
ncbi:MAG TPA: 5-oxoprolinase subunit PxpA [Xanthomonadaceae bacterium]|nr:5-oxoprolinase subunit PxpA [Xanthomonadaceae bacterium]